VELATFEELNQAVDAIGDVSRRDSLLLTGSSYATLEPVPQHNWEETLEHPLRVR
jgi:hypothetical protein